MPLAAQERAGPDMDSLLPPATSFSRESMEKMLDEARALVGQQRYAEAITAMRLYLEKAPDDDQARLELARVYAWAERYGDAARLYAKLLETVPDDPELRLEHARVLLWDGKYEEAAQSLASLREHLGPPLPTEAPPDADVEYSPALASQGPDAQLERIDRALADAWAWSGQLDKAVPLYERLWRLHGDDQTLGLAYARALSQRRSYPQALEVYQQLLAMRPTDAALRLERGRVLLWSEKYAEGLKELLSLRESFRNKRAVPAPSAEMLDELNRVIAAGYTWAGRYVQAAQEYTKLAEAHPQEADLQLELARVLRELNQLDTSLVHYDKYLTMRSGDLLVALERARALLWAQRFADAIRSFEALRQRLEDPAQSTEITDAERQKYLEEVERMLTRSYLWSGKSLEALPHLMRLTQRNPADATLALELARALAQSGQLEASRQTYARYQELGGDPGSAILGEGLTWQWEGDLLRAQAAFERARQASPDNAEVQKALAELAPQLRKTAGGTLYRRSDSEGFSQLTLSAFGEQPYQLYWLGGDVELDVFGQTGSEHREVARLTPLARGRHRLNSQLSGKAEAGLQLTLLTPRPVWLKLAAEGTYLPDPRQRLDVRLETSEASDQLFTWRGLEQRFRQAAAQGTYQASMPGGYQLWSQLKLGVLWAPSVACDDPEGCGNRCAQAQVSVDRVEALDRPIQGQLRLGASAGLLRYAREAAGWDYWSPGLYASAGLRAGVSSTLLSNLGPGVRLDARLRLGLGYASDVAQAFPELSGELYASQDLTDRIFWRLEAGYGRSMRRLSALEGSDSSDPTYSSGRFLFSGWYRF